jgi:hypothetical protein
MHSAVDCNRFDFLIHHTFPFLHKSHGFALSKTNVDTFGIILQAKTIDIAWKDDLIHPLFRIYERKEVNEGKEESKEQRSTASKERFHNERGTSKENGQQ